MFRPIKLGKHIEIYLSSMLLIVFALVFDFANRLLLTYILVLLHEIAHVLTATLLHVGVQKIEILPFGITMRLENNNIKKPAHEAAIAAAGPVCSAALAVVSYALQVNGILSLQAGSFLIAANCAIVLMNIVPALPLDGGRMLRALLTERWGYVKAFNFTMVITKAVAVLMLGLGVFVLFYTKFNFSLLLICAFLIANIYSEQRGSKLVIMRELLYSKEKLTSGGTERADLISIMEYEPARKALRLMGYNRYYIIQVIGKDMQIIKSVTETRLIEQLIEQGMRVKARDL